MKATAAAGKPARIPEMDIREEAAPFKEKVMAYSINTNIASMQAQEYLRMTSDFQAKTINRVTSGLRIISSGDDAAGLAIANSFRSDQAVLSQGIRNANDGLATLQTIDGGINNISKLLDRARTLAAQSATGTFSGSRDVVNSEFQSVLSEIDRQAQAIGLNSGGTFAKSLAVFIGGGRGPTDADQITNGSVSVDLTTSTVDTQSLGLKGVEAKGAVTGGLQASSSQSVADILADGSNTTAIGGFTDFYMQGPAFSGSGRIKISVNTSGVGTTADLVGAVNAAIEQAGKGASAAAAAFKAANITASVATDANGLEQLAFSSSTAAFQVKAGDRMANALLGNTTVSTGTTGKAVETTVTGVHNGLTTAFAAGTKTVVRFQGGGLDQAVDLSIDTGGLTVQQAANALKTAVDNSATLSAAGITLDAFDSDGFTAGTDNLVFRNATGESFSVSATGDSGNRLGLGSWYLNDAGAADYTSITAFAAPVDTVATSLRFQIGNGDVIDVGVTIDTDSDTTAPLLNAAIASDADAAKFQAAGITFGSDGTHLTISSSNGTNFRVMEIAAATGLGFDNGTGAAVYTTAATASNGQAAASVSNVATIEASGAYQAGTAGAGDFFGFDKIMYGNADQTVTVTAVNSSGQKEAAAVTLNNDSTTSANNYGRSIDEAVAKINAVLQQSNKASLQGIVAVKDNDGTNEGIRFLSTGSNYEVSLGSSGANEGIKNEAGDRSVTLASTQVGTGSNVDISTQAGAESAVSALAAAVTALGNSQAVVGKGQNQFNYAVSLASTQLTNLAASESRIRDADLAAEAANLTKAQILQQAGVAALAQANSAPQAVLSLLRG